MPVRTSPSRRLPSAARRILPGLLVGSVLATALLGCGGVSQEDFAADANEVCASFSTWSAGKQESFRDALATGDEGAAAALLIEYERRFDRTLKKIDSLEAPDDDADRKAIDRFLTVGSQQADLLPDLAAAIEAGDLAELEDLSAEGEDLEAKLGRAARAYDLDDCASGPVQT
ncbi:MAG: hypothetical protein ACKOB2_03640 [Solirubrobacterales bacterium]